MTRTIYDSPIPGTRIVEYTLKTWRIEGERKHHHKKAALERDLRRVQCTRCAHFVPTKDPNGFGDKTGHRDPRPEIEHDCGDGYEYTGGPCRCVEFWRATMYEWWSEGCTAGKRPLEWAGNPHDEIPPKAPWGEFPCSGYEKQPDYWEEIAKDMEALT